METKKEAFSIELQQYVLSQPVCVIRGLATALKLGTFTCLVSSVFIALKIGMFTCLVTFLSRSLPSVFIALKQGIFTCLMTVLSVRLVVNYVICRALCRIKLLPVTHVLVDT